MRVLTSYRRQLVWKCLAQFLITDCWIRPWFEVYHLTAALSGLWNTFSFLHRKRLSPGYLSTVRSAVFGREPCNGIISLVSSWKCRLLVRVSMCLLDRPSCHPNSPCGQETKVCASCMLAVRYFLGQVCVSCMLALHYLIGQVWKRCLTPSGTWKHVCSAKHFSFSLPVSASE